MASRAAQRSWRLTGGGNPQNPADWLLGLIGGDRTATGRRIDGNAAMHLSTVFAACRNLGQDVGTLPLPVFDVSPSGEKGKRLRDDPTDRLLNRTANDEGLPAYALRGAMQGHGGLRGNGYAEIEFDKAMRPRGLWPLRPDRMRLVRNGINADISGADHGQLAYAYTLPNGRERIFAPDRILHLRGFGDGLEGHSVVSLAAEGIALALAAEEFGERFFANDARPGVVITRPKEVASLKREARQRLRAEWEDAHQSLEKKHRIAILQEGMDIKEVGIPPEDAQFLQTRVHQASFEIGNWFRMPPDKLMDYSHATFTNVEHSDLVYTKYTLRYWFVAWEQEIATKLLLPDRIAEHNAEGLLRGDQKARGEFYSTLRSAGGITPNQIADRENFPRHESPVADQILIPLNSVPASALDAHGMTMRDRVNNASVLVRAGFDPAAALAAMGLPEIAHSGLVPITVTVDPATVGATT